MRIDNSVKSIIKRRLFSLVCICSLILNGCNNKVNVESDVAEKKYYGNVYNTFGLIAVKGNYYDNPQVLFDYWDSPVEVIYEDSVGWDAMKKHLDTIDRDDEPLHCIWEQNGFTIIEDRDGLLGSGTKMLQTLSDTLGTRVFAASNQKMTGTFMFFLADKGLNREIIYAEGLKMKVEGERLPAEGVMDVNKEFDFEELYTLLAALGIDWFEVKNVKRFKIVRETKFKV